MAAWGFGLGPITVYSAASEPLRADIELLATRPDQIGDIHAVLASEQEFEWVGIPKRAVLDQLRFRPMVDARGRAVIRITSPRPLDETFLDFLVEVSGPNGHLVREYTLLQDRGVAPAAPPPPQTMATQGPRAEGAGALIRRIGPQGGTAPAHATPLPADGIHRGDRPPERSATAQGQDLPREYLTRPGDSLLRIGRRYARVAGVPTTAMAEAIFYSNPGAFVSADMNRLKAGARLQIPAAEAVPRLAALNKARPPAQTPAALPPPPPAPPAAVPPSPAPHPPAAAPPPSPLAPGATAAPAGAEPPSTPPAPIPAELETQLPAEPALEIVGKEAPQAAGPSGPQPDRSSALYVAQLEKTVQLAQELAESRRQENASLAGHIDRLNAVLTKQERLIELQNSQMSELRRRLEAALDAVGTSGNDPWYLLVALLTLLSILLALIAVRLWRLARRHTASPVQSTPHSTPETTTGG